MDFSNTKFSLSRPVVSYAKVQSLIAALRRNRRSQFRSPKLETRLYLDIGCGANVDPSFVNLDYGWRPGIDVVCDITKGIPFRDGRFEGIFTEHCLEHVPFEKADCVLKECFRILMPLGTLRIVVPDGQLYLRRYVECLDGGNEPLPYSEGDPYEGLYSPIMSVNRIFRSHGHLFVYDFDTFDKLLSRNGFCEIKRQAYAVGRNPELLRDTKHREVESLYVEATKPSGSY